MRSRSEDITRIGRDNEALSKDSADKRASIQRLLDQISENEKRITNNQEKQKALQGEIEKGNAWLASNKKPSAEEVTLRLTQAQNHNAKCGQLAQFTQKSAEVITLKEKLNKIVEDIASIDKQKQLLIKDSNLPVPGLSFTDDQVFYEGLPLEETQVQKSKIIEIGVRIAMAMNPNLRTIVISDGSLLDKNTYASILAVAQEKGYQMLIEMVDWNGAKEEIFFAEEYLGK